MNQDKLLTVVEAAQLAKVSDHTIRPLAKQGRLKSKKLYGRRLIYTNSLISWKEAREKRGQSRERRGPQRKELPAAYYLLHAIYRDYLLPEDALNAVLDTLTEREKFVIRSRFGLGGNVPKTLQEIAQDFSVTRARISQIEHKALRKLRHPGRTRKLLGRSEHHNVTIIICEACKKVLPVGTEALLQRSIEELDLSVRAYNCLKNAGLNTLESLLYKDRRSLLRIKNVGKKVVAEMEELLTAQGLRLGLLYEKESNELHPDARPQQSRAH